MGKLKLENLKFEDDSIDFQYTKIRLPENSAYIDYSKYPLDPYMASANSSFYTAENAWYYDQEMGFAVNRKADTYYADFPLSFPGDHGSLYYTDDWFDMSQYSTDGWDQYSNYKIRRYNATGLTRTYTPFENFMLGKNANWNEYHNIHGKLSYIMQTVTLPINTVLFYGAEGTKQYNYEWQSSNGTWNGKDATEAVRLVTKEACEKLKKNNNLRVYLIKYRKQLKYKHPVTQAETGFDYSYLDSCATDSSEPYLYENVTDEAGLKSALDAIYSDITSANFAPRTEARNVNV